MTDHDPTTVECPDCLVPAGTPCIVSTSDTPVHAARRRLVDLRNLDHGICALCARPMVRGSVEDSPVDAWHPDPTDAAACPNLGDPATDWERYAANTNDGLTPGHPGAEHFVLTPGIPLSMTAGIPAADPACTCVAFITRTDYGTSIEHDVDAGSCPVHAPPLLCPECTQSKHGNCRLEALDPITDEIVACACNDDAHRTAADA